jgi:hypothetical protein
MTELLKKHLKPSLKVRYALFQGLVYALGLVAFILSLVAEQHIIAP